MKPARSVSVFYSALAGVLIMWTAAASLRAASPQQARADQSQAHPAPFRVTRSLCGSKGTSHGTEYEIQDPRNVFHVPEDHQIIVYFEWEGSPGSHHAVGSWRSPDGKVVLNSEFDLTSQGTRYVGYWTLAIPESIAPGLWALEAQIDGQPAGTQTFQIISSRSTSAPAPMPTPAEIYQRAAPASVFVTSLDQDGVAFTRGFGFFIEKGVVLTAFQVIDGASSLRVDLADGSHVTLNDVVAWNRSQDWAILKVESAKVQPLEKAAPGSWKIGDLDYLLTSQGQGSRTIQSVNIAGLQGTVKSAQRLNLSEFASQRAVGAPLLDGYGRVIGLLGGGLAGLSSPRMGTWSTYVDSGEVAPANAEPTVLPLDLIPEAAASQQAVTLADLAGRGTLMMPLPRDTQVANGTLCEDFQKFGGEAIMPLRARREFSRKVGTLALVVIWAPRIKIKSTQQLRIYDSGNQAVAQTAPGKIDLQPRVTRYTAWKMSLTSLPPGIYRIDVLVGGQPQWREFFRVVD